MRSVFLEHRTSTSGPVSDIAHDMADDSQLAEATQALSFAEFLERMKDPQAANLVRSIKKCVFHRLSQYASARACSSSITFQVHRERKGLIRLCFCSFIKTFDEKGGKPDKDAESVQVTSLFLTIAFDVCACQSRSVVRSQGFLAKSEGTFRDHPVWANVPVEHQSQAMEVTYVAFNLQLRFEQDLLRPYIFL